MKKPPTTLKDYVSLAKEFNTPAHAGTIASMKPVETALNEARLYMNAIGDGWIQTRPVAAAAAGGEDGQLTACIEVVERLETESIPALDVDGHAINAEVELRENPCSEMTMAVRFDKRESHFFDCET